jgi:hypothetical protein
MVTIYHRLGIDPTTTFDDLLGRPIAICSNGKVIAELCSIPSRLNPLQRCCCHDVPLVALASRVLCVHRATGCMAGIGLQGRA